VTVRAHLLLACLQIALWFFRAFSLGESTPLTTLALGMFLWYHCLNAVLGSVRLDRMTRLWALLAGAALLSSTIFPVLLGVEGRHAVIFFRTVLFSLPCLALYLLPILAAAQPRETPWEW
jgi:hypothetical protein